MSTIIYIFLTIICALLIWDISILRKIKKDGERGFSTLTDEKCFELKFHIRLLQSIAAILIFGATFFGYSTYNGIKIEVDEDLNTLKDTMEILKKNVSRYNETVEYNPRIYVVNDVKYPNDRNEKYEGGIKIYFKYYLDRRGDSLPNFKDAPLLNVQGNTIELSVMEITEKYFRVSKWSSMLNDSVAEKRGYKTFDI